MIKNDWIYKTSEEIGEPMPDGTLKWHKIKDRQFTMTEMQAKNMIQFQKEFDKKHGNKLLQLNLSKKSTTWELFNF